MENKLLDNLSTRLRGLSATATREIFKLITNKEIVSFAGGVPAAEALPISEINEITNDILSDKTCARVAIQYGATEGLAVFREQLIEYAKRFGIENITTQNIIITSGGQQSLDLVFRAFLDRGDTILVENPTYLSVLQIVKANGASAVGVKSLKDGLDIKDLEKKIISTKPKILYCVPTFSNPTGKTYTLENRKAILEVCNKYNVLILEDDPYSLLRYSGKSVPSIKSLDTTGSVVYIASFSKVVSPGLRVGFSIGDTDIIEKMVLVKQGSDLHTSNLSQAIMSEFFTRNLLDKVIQRNLPLYKERRDVILSALKKYMLPNVKFTTPEGGLFIWIELDKSADTTILFHEAIANKVAFITGQSFFAEREGLNTLRLNFSAETPQRIEQGIKALAEVLKK